MAHTWHVMPTADAVEHDATDDCICGPQIVPLPTGDGDIWWAYLHHALTMADVGREAYIQQLRDWAARQGVS